MRPNACNREEKTSDRSDPHAESRGWGEEPRPEPAGCDPTVERVLGEARLRPDAYL